MNVVCFERDERKGRLKSSAGNDNEMSSKTAGIHKKLTGILCLI
jgi:hypothetical protein